MRARFVGLTNRRSVVPTKRRSLMGCGQSLTPFVSLVAIGDGQVVGHIFFSPISIEEGGPAPAAKGLAPMAVSPEWQRQGVGSLLVREGLEVCRTGGCDVVVVVGHPGYYPPFGFVPAGQKGLSCEYDVPDDVFMVAELRLGALSGVRGMVKYHEAFGGV